MGNCCYDNEESNLINNFELQYKDFNLNICTYSYIHNMLAIKYNNKASFMEKFNPNNFLILIINKNIKQNIKKVIENNNILSLNIDNFLNLNAKEIKNLKILFDFKRLIIFDFEIILDKNKNNFFDKNTHYKEILDKFKENSIIVNDIFIFYDKNKKRIWNLINLKTLNFELPFYLFNSYDMNKDLDNQFKIFLTINEDINRTNFNLNYGVEHFIFINKNIGEQNNNYHYWDSNWKINIYEILIKSKKNILLIINESDFKMILKVIEEILKMLFQINKKKINNYLNSLFDIKLVDINDNKLLSYIKDLKREVIDYQKPIKIIKKLLSNIIGSTPKDKDKFRIIKKNNKTWNNNIYNYSSGLLILKFIGFKDSDDCYINKKNKEELNKYLSIFNNN